ncbi:MAG: hypothetical protein WBM65_10850 [Sedimenticolaceae bacterium]
MFADQFQALPLLLAPLRGLTVEEIGVDATVELVDVHDVDPVLQPVVLGLNPPDGILVVLLLVTVADPQGLRHPGEDLVIEAQAIEQFGKPFLQHLLPSVRLGAFPLGAAAVVVDVAALLDLGDHRAAAVPAADQAGERELALGLSRRPRISTIEHRLRFIPKLTVDDWLVVTLVGLPLPDEFAHVDRIAQHLVHAAAGHRISAFPECQARLTRHPGGVLHRKSPSCVPFEHLTDHGHQLRVWFDGLLAVFTENVSVAVGSIGWPDSLLCFLGHPLSGLFRKVVDIVLRHQHLDAVHELLG